MCCPTGTDAEDAPVYPGPADVPVSAVGRHGNSGSTGLPLHAADDHPHEDVAVAPPLQPQGAADCESCLVADVILTSSLS